MLMYIYKVISREVIQITFCAPWNKIEKENILKLLVELELWHGIRATVTRGHGFKSQPPLIWSGIFSTGYEEDLCRIHTFSPKSLVWRGVLGYITYHETSTINISFWLNWFLNIFKHPKLLEQAPNYPHIEGLRSAGWNEEQDTKRRILDQEVNQ